MSTEKTLAQNDMLGMMSEDKPYAAYIKTILGQVAVTVWDAVLQKPVDVILKGNPKKKEEDTIVKVWNKKEDDFFRRVNRSHFSTGRVIPYVLPENEEPVKLIEQSTDEELVKIINSKFITLNSQLNKIDSVPVLFRMKGLAEDLEKSEKITSAIEKRISELQVAEYIKPAETGVTEEE